MITNYFKIAVRNLWRNKSFSAINIFGLAIGLATCLLITLYVKDELDYDSYHEKADRIYRLDADFLVNGSAFNERTVPATFAEVLRKDYPQIENSVRIFPNGDGHLLVKKDNQTLMETGAVFADSTIFDVFTMPMIAGNSKTALREPHSMVLSETMAKKYFNSTDVIGKTLLTGNVEWYTITGVIRDMPAQSHVHYNFIKAMSELEDSRQANWMSDNYETYLLLRPGTTAKDLTVYLREATRKYMDVGLKKLTGSSMDELEKKGGHFGYTPIALTRIHLYSPLTNEAEPGGNIQYVYIFIVIAVFILLIACVNFMNLSTARSAGRAREVGVRKVLGSDRSDLISQFLVESVVTAFIALAVALVIAAILLPYLNLLAGKQIALHLFSTAWTLPVLILVAIAVGLLAGSYPAFFLSAFEPVKVLKGKIASGFKGGWLRNSLVVFQFATAIMLIVGTLVIYSQLQYIQNKNLGYHREQVLELKNTASLWIHAKNFKSEVLQIPGVEAGTMTNALPTSGMMNTNVYSKDAARSEGQVMGLGEWFVDADYIPALGMKMASGRNFSPLLPTDTTSSIIINQTAARVLGFRDPLNQNLYVGGYTFKIIGVVEDFNSGSLRNKIPPLVLRLGEPRDVMAFRIRTTNIASVLEQIERKYHAVDNMAGQPFLYMFMDEDFNKLYQSEQRTGKIFISFAVFAILIACLGLFGLVTYAAEQRTKEIGIRKVLGASVANIVNMLSGDFVKLVIIAAVIAFPIAWWTMGRWLQDFAYRTTISAWIFVIAGCSALVITLITVSFRAIKAALTNPVESLKAE